MDNLLRAVTGYLDFLRQNQKLGISVHFSKEALLTLPHAAWISLAEYTSHQNPYCMAVKKDHHRACIQCQQETRAGCTPNRGFCRSCHAGVLEYLYPIGKGQEIIGYIAVMAVCLFLNSYFKTLAAGHLTATQLYPLNQGGSVILSMLMSALLFRERINARCILGVTLSFGALLMINLL